MDTERIDRLGTRPIKPLVDAVAALRDVRDMAAFLGEFERLGGHGLFGSYVNTDDRNSDRYLFHLVQGGLGLPDESYYRDEKFAAIREAYVAYLATVLRLVDAEDPDAGAQTVLDIDTRLAAGHWERAETRDVQKTYNLKTIAELRELCPGLRLGRLRHQPQRLGARGRRAARRDLRAAAVVLRAPLDRARRGRRSRTGGPGCSPGCCARRRPTSPTTSSRPTSTSTAAPSTARPSCGPAGSAA